MPVALSELHYITPVENIPSILRRGILSHRRAQQFRSPSVANPSVQNIRARLVLPSGRPLHDYANLYINARNPMMYFLKDQHRDLAVLSLSTDVLDLPGVIVADGNASRTQETAFWAPRDGLARLDSAVVFAQYWTDPDPYVQHEKKRIRCAEVLVPDAVAPSFIRSCYASCEETLSRLRLTAKTLETKISEHMFFL